jgi:hypothetical protein
MNIEHTTNDKYIHRYEGFWRDDDHKRDLIKNLYPIPKKYKNTWNSQFLFARKLQKIQDNIRNQESTDIKNTKCRICDKLITNNEYELKRVHWKDSLLHYIVHHNHKPSFEFMDFVLSHYVGLSDSHITLPSMTFTKRKNKYVKIDKNQLQIIDALMKNGGIKSYEDSNGNLKYSEHAGLLLFDNDVLNKLVVAANSTRIIDDDPDIFMPSNMIEAFDCEYIFHTHPATPKPGSRVNVGVLYEFPSANDIVHFMSHSTLGKTRASLVIAPEGLYIIKNKKRHISSDLKSKIDIILFNDTMKEEFIKLINEKQRMIQNKYIQRWNKITVSKFYNDIIYDTSYMKSLNKFLEQFNVKIDYYPRIKNNKGEMILDTVYISV